MVRRLLLTALLATLAVALPAAAEEDPLLGLPAESGDEGCLPDDLTCVAENLAPWESGSKWIAGGECSPWYIHLPDNNQPLTDTVVIDPEGCLRRFLWGTAHDTLEDLPPASVDWEASWPSAQSLSLWI